MEPNGVVLVGDVVAQLRAAGCVYAEEEAAILLEAAGDSTVLAGLLRRRVAGDPLEQIVGWAGFCGLRIKVAPGVFVPRRRTEFLVSRALEAFRSAPGPAGCFLDLCCGSGAVGTALAAALPGLHGMGVHAADIDPAAVACAVENLAPYGGRVHCGDLFAPVPKEFRHAFTVIVANAPYVPEDDIAFMPSEARLHEPGAALNGGPDGLDLHRRIAAEAPGWLRPGGWLLLETSGRQASRSQQILERSGFSAATAHNGEVDGTVVAGQLRGGRAATPAP
jgi:release factor glutamine methyltransferase